MDYFDAFSININDKVLYMGNQNVYGEGHFITPNKVRRPSQMDENAFSIENLFGKVNIETARG